MAKNVPVKRHTRRVRQDKHGTAYQPKGTQPVGRRLPRSHTIQAYLVFMGHSFRGPITFDPSLDDEGARAVLSTLGQIIGTKAVPIDVVERIVQSDSEVYEFVAQPDSRGELPALGRNLARAGMYLLVSIAAKHAVAWIAGTVGGPVGLVLTVALTGASMIRT